MNVIRIRNLEIGEGPVKVCVPLVAGTREALLAEAGEVVAMQPDLVEWRADCYEVVRDPGLVTETIAALRGVIGDTPLIFTCRVDREGGNCSMPEETRFQIIKAALETKLVDILDIELNTEKQELDLLRACAKGNGAQVILSYHDFEKTPPVEDMMSRLRLAREWGADMAKIAVMPRRAADVLNLLYAACLFKEETGMPLIAVSMSKMGLVSRVAGGVFGSAVTFAAGRESSAPGQIRAEALRGMLEALSL